MLTAVRCLHTHGLAYGAYTTDATDAWCRNNALPMPSTIQCNVTMQKAADPDDALVPRFAFRRHVPVGPQFVGLT